VGKRKIEIVVNGAREEVPDDATIASLIEHFRERDVHLVIELNGQFVYPRHYERTAVKEGDRIEFINPNFGG
jgi:thiamine biosynthesis protein ThiS